MYLIACIVVSGFVTKSVVPFADSISLKGFHMQSHGYLLCMHGKTLLSSLCRISWGHKEKLQHFCSCICLIRQPHLSRRPCSQRSKPFADDMGHEAVKGFYLIQYWAAKFRSATVWIAQLIRHGQRCKPALRHFGSLIHHWPMPPHESCCSSLMVC